MNTFHGHRRDRGSVTAETAVLLPAIVAMVALAVWVVGVAGAQVRTTDAARTGARAVARGEAVEAALAAAAKVAPAGATVHVTRDGDFAVVEVRVRSVLPGPWHRRGPGIDLRSRGIALVER